MNDSFKFWVQTLLIPVVLAVTGYFINATLSQKQREAENFKFMENVMREAFDSQSPIKALALAKLLPHLTEDQALADTLAALIRQNFKVNLAEAVKSGNDSATLQYVKAAEAVKDTTTQHLVTKTKQALDLETKGYEAIQAGDLQRAQKHFELVEKTYPSFHSAYEISRILKKKTRELKQGADSAAVTREVQNEVKRMYPLNLQMARVDTR